MNIKCNTYSKIADAYSEQPLSSQLSIDKSSNDVSSLVKPEFLDSLDKSTLAIKDAQGNFQQAWVQELIVSSQYLNNLQELEKLLPSIQAGRVEDIKIALRAGFSRKLRFLQGDTLLHLAVHYQQLDIVKLLLQDIPPVEIKELLQQTNSQKKTPIELAQALGCSHTEIYSILSHFQRTVEKEVCSSPATPPPASKNNPLALTWNTIIELEKQLMLLTNESKFKSFTPYLVPLCQLVTLTCQQAIETLQVDEKIRALEEELLFPLFGDKFDKLDKDKLCKNISRVHNFYQSLIQKNTIDDKIKLSIKYLEPGKTTHEKIIYLNPLKLRNKVTRFITVMLHEASHLVNLSKDIKYFKSTIEDWAIDFKSCSQLMIDDSSVISAEYLQLLALESCLENNLNLTNQLAHKNADTFTVATLALAAYYSHRATICDKILLINTPDFLEDLFFLSKDDKFSPIKDQLPSRSLKRPPPAKASLFNCKQAKWENDYYSDASTTPSHKAQPVQPFFSNSLPDLSNSFMQLLSISDLSQAMAAIPTNNGTSQPIRQWAPTRAISNKNLPHSLLSRGKATLKSHQANPL